ncbi:hypothetical protein D7V86_05460 [bacterium D16-51]|nr:hypothetical protein D7V96_12355 [bacterium D16-59]RKI61510.1 hypothetical protein D7V86_05460 [bacterium D16-51]
MKNRNVNIITDAGGKLVLINDIRFKAKANAAQSIPELIRIAANPKHEANRKEKHKTDAVYGWYRYNIRFALPVYDDKMGKVTRHNIYSASMLVRHANDDRKYLYDILAIKKEMSSPLK